MTPTYFSRRVIVERLSLLNHMIGQIQRLPLHDEGAFFSDSRNVHTAESCLRRALEDLASIRSAFQRWIRDNSHKIDNPLTDADG